MTQKAMPLSATGKQWKLKPLANQNLAQKLGVSEIIGRILSNRHPDLEIEEAFQFLSPQLSHLQDPNHLLGMTDAVQRIIQAIRKKERIAIFGDYDVDGACASAIFLRYFKILGIDADLYIPDRLSEGYGPNPQAMETLKKDGVNLIITVDSGSTAQEALERAKQLDMDVIVTDHHQCLPILPPAVAVVNPNRVDENSPYTMLCGAGVAFFVLMALNRALRGQGFFEVQEEPDLRKLMDLVAVATICDMVPLTGPNRPLVQRGLQVLNQRQNLGMHALLSVIGIEGGLTGYHAGFQIGPRINAGGRLAESDLGARLLATEDETEAYDIANRLNKLNEERKAVQEAVLQEALTQAQSQADNAAIIVSGAGWHPGVVGIVAARVKEQFYRPTFVLAVGEDGTATGSGRSIYGVNLGQAVQACHTVTERGGGHAMAAGVTVKQDKLEAFQTAMLANIQTQADEQEDVFTPTVTLDAILQPQSLNEELLAELKRLEPYGSGHREPTFAMTGVILRDVRTVGADGRHVKISAQGADGAYINGISFGAMDTNLGPFLQQHRGQKVSLAGVIKENTFNGQTRPDFHITDAHISGWESE